MKNAKSFTQGLAYGARVLGASAALYLSSLANPNMAYTQEAPKDTTISGKSYRCSPAILSGNIQERKCVYSDIRIPISKGLERKVDTLVIKEYIPSKPDTVKIVQYDTIRVVEEKGGEVDLPPRPTGLPPPERIEADNGIRPRFHFNVLGGKNDYQIMGAEAGLVWRFLGVSANYARGFNEVTKTMSIDAPHNIRDIGDDTKSDFNILGAALELHPVPYVFVGAGYNIWNQNREIVERKVSMPDSTDLAINSHSEVENGKAIRYFGGINIPFTDRVWLKLIGGVYKYDKKDENKLGKPLYFAGIGSSIAIK